MSTVLSIALWLAVVAAVAWVCRFAGQKLTQDAPRFRNMPFGVAFGYVLGAVVLSWLIWGFMQSRSADPAVANKFFFLGVAIKAFLVFSAAAWLFRLLGRNVGTAGTRKLFRTIPLTAAFGILVIIIYAILAIFASLIAP